MGTVIINGKAEKEFTADIMKIIISVNAENTDYKTALSKGKKETEKLLGMLTSLGYNLSDIMLNEEEVEEHGKTQYNPKHYTFEKKVSLVTSSDLKNLELISNSILEKNITAEYAHEFKLSNQSKLENDVLKEALIDSRKKAEMIAETIGQKITGIEKAKASNTRSYFAEYDDEGDELDCICRAMPACDSFSSRISPDKIKISKEIEVTWIME